MTDAPETIWATADFHRWAIDSGKLFQDHGEKGGTEYTRADIHATALARIDEAENQLDSARHSVTVLEAKGAVSQARIAELDAALVTADHLLFAADTIDTGRTNLNKSIRITGSRVLEMNVPEWAELRSAINAYGIVRAALKAKL
jgi:hypothetical protein